MGWTGFKRVNKNPKPLQRNRNVFSGRMGLIGPERLLEFGRGSKKAGVAFIRVGLDKNLDEIAVW